MLFNSSQFLFFFLILFFLYYSIPHRYRWVLLLIASYYFYACWKVEYLVLIWISTVVDYAAAILMARYPGRRTLFLSASLIANLGMLFFFKYYGFVSSSIEAAFEPFDIMIAFPHFDYLLPVGISFYTFQTLSYTIDVFRGERKPELHFGKFALYVTYFPQLVAGPIERSTRLLPQFHQAISFNYTDVKFGLMLMAWGFFKKVCIADRVAVYVNDVYNSPADFYGIQVWIATYLFAFQIYCDFSGYSDIAIGASAVLGIKLMKNFDLPYASRSIGEFWRRWHISLSTWFKDYVYIPLGGNRVSPWRWYFNLLVTFIISGVWHGANWTFIIWGCLHGVYMVFGLLTSGVRTRFVHSLFGENSFILRIIQTVATFHLVVLAWVFFRANSLDDAMILLRNMFDFQSGSLNLFGVLGVFEFTVAVFSIVLMEVIQFFQSRGSIREWINRQPFYVRWTIYYCMIMTILFLARTDSSNEFIYFQF